MTSNKSNNQHPPQTSSPIGRTWFALLLGVVLVVAAGAAYGHYSHRWGPPADLAAAGEHLKSMPTRLDEWEMQSEEEMSDSVVRMLECAGYVNRRYVNSVTGETVNIALLVGPPGPIAVHTPEICYSSRDYAISDERQRASIGDDKTGEQTFWDMTLESKDAFAERLSVFYGWSDGKEWVASASPRFEFAASPLLFKLQLAGPVDPRQADAEAPPTKRFLQSLINSGWTLTKD